MPRFISSPTASKTSKQNHWNWDHQHQQTIIFSYTNYGIFLHLKCTEGSKEGEQYWWLDWFLYSIFFLLLFLSIQGTLYMSWRDRTPNLPTSRWPARATTTSILATEVHKHATTEKYTEATVIFSGFGRTLEMGQCSVRPALACSILRCWKRKDLNWDTSESPEGQREVI